MNKKAIKAINDIETTRPTGAWGMSRGGSWGSINEASIGVTWLMGQPWRKEFAIRASRVCVESEFPLCLMLAIASRESNFGRSLRDGYGDNGNGFGMMQVDRRYHDVDRSDPLGVAHLEQAVGIAKDMYREVSEKHPDWDETYKIKGMVVAYNSGRRNVQTIERMDKGTTGNDYGADVLARAKYFLKMPIF